MLISAHLASCKTVPAEVGVNQSNKVDKNSTHLLTGCKSYFSASLVTITTLLLRQYLSITLQHSKVLSLNWYYMKL